MIKHISLFTSILFFTLNTIAAQCFNLNIESREVGPNQVFCQDYVMQSDGPISGFQWTIQFDPNSLNFDTILNINPQIENFASNTIGFIAEGKIPISGIANVSNAINIQIPEVLFTLCFESKDTFGLGSQLSSSEAPTPIAIFDIDFEPYDLCESPGTITLSNNPSTDVDFYVYAAINDIDCANGQAGSIDMYTFFGSAPYTYAWTGPNNYTNLGSSISQLQPGDFDVTVTDADGNSETHTYTVLGSSNPTIDQPNITRPVCYNDSTGVIDITINFGAGPYIYVWSNNTFEEDLTNVPPGTYSVTVVDNNGCEATDSWILNQSSYGIEFVTTGSPTCYFSNDGYIDLTPNQSAALPLTYEWNTGADTEDLNNIGQGFYNVLITDANNCESFFDFDLSIPPPPTANEMITCSTLGGNNGAISIVLTPASSDYIFSWDDNDPDQNGNRMDLAPGIYKYSVSDLSGCELIIDSVEIVPSMQSYVDAYFSCELDSIQFSFDVAPGAFSYSWTPAQDFDIPDSPNAIYLPPPFDFSVPYQDTIVSTLTLTAAGGCVSHTDFELRPREFCVWPGDSNDDRAVSALDLLNIGLANGSAGLARWPLSTEWFAQPQTDFGNIIPGTSLDASYADCDGNGMVEAADTTIVVQNFGLSHYGFNGEKPASRAMDVPLSIVLPESFKADEQSEFEIILGADVQSVNQAHGIAFQIVYDPELVNIDRNKVVADGWLSESGEVWTIDLDHGTSGLMDVVLTRTDQVGVDGFGKIASLQMKFLDFAESKDIELAIRNAYLVDSQGSYLSVDGMMSSSVLVGTTVSTQETIFANEYIFPNPVNAFLTIQTERNIQSALIYTSTGQLVNQYEFSENTINTSELTSGLYFIHLVGEAGTGIYKFIKL